MNTRDIIAGASLRTLAVLVGRGKITVADVLELNLLSPEEVDEFAKKGSRMMRAELGLSVEIST